MAILIPEKLHIVFINRPGTVDGKLSFVSYYDKNNINPNIAAQNKWVHQNKLFNNNIEIAPLEIENKPSDGFILNTGVKHNNLGSGHYYSSGRTLMRIYSPDEFEFEITIDNFCFIMQYADMSKKYINCELVLCYKGKKLFLLPTASEEYSKALKYSTKQYHPEILKK